MKHNEILGNYKKFDKKYTELLREYHKGNESHAKEKVFLLQVITGLACLSGGLGLYIVM
ncbi:MAG: hypothetical protein R3Y63_15955 [Eubacteriales bacterium]